MPDELADREVWLATQLTRLTCYLFTFVQFLLFLQRPVEPGGGKYSHARLMRT